MLIDLQGVAEGAEVVHVHAEDEVAELREGEEDDEEHDAEAEQVNRSTVDGRRQCAQRLSEVDVLEQLHACYQISNYQYYTHLTAPFPARQPA